MVIGKTVNVTLQVNARPTLADLGVAPQSLNFTAAESVLSSPSAVLTLKNNGGMALSWTGSVTTTDGTPWLSLSTASGTTPASGGAQTVKVNVNPAGLFAATYTGSVTISDPLALDSPQTVGVTLIVSTAPPPVLQVSSALLDFVATAGSASPVDQALQIGNSGGGIVQWTSSVRTTNGGNWLTFAPDHGSAAGGTSAPAVVHMTLAGLTVGTYSGTIAIASPSSVTQNLAVTLHVNPGLQSTRAA